jgi:hypothetical protein
MRKEDAEVAVAAAVVECRWAVAEWEAWAAVECGWVAVVAVAEQEAECR